MKPIALRWPCAVAALLSVVLLLVATAGIAFAAPYAAVVMDARSGEILYARNHDTRLHPASLTKMMTLYIAFEAVQNGEITLDTMVRISANAASERCSCLGLRSGQTIALRYLIRGAALRSGNDAATAIGEAISGSEAAFAQRMTRTAQAMGMTNTTFRNAHGLTHQQHLSTARDMAILSRQLFFDFPQYYNIFSREFDDAGVARVQNTNWRLLNSYSGADGIKTGYTNAAGYNLSASAERNGVRVIAVMFGGTSVVQRTNHVAELLDTGFERAQLHVATRPPAPPDYGNVRTASAASTINPVISRSPIPQARPAPVAEPPDEFMIAMRDSIGATLAEVVQSENDPPPASEAPPGVELAQAIPDLLPDTRPPEIESAAAVVQQSAAAAEDLPFEVVVLDPGDDLTLPALRPERAEDAGGEPETPVVNVVLVEGAGVNDLGAPAQRPMEHPVVAAATAAEAEHRESEDAAQVATAALTPIAPGSFDAVIAEALGDGPDTATQGGWQADIALVEAPPIAVAARPDTPVPAPVYQPDPHIVLTSSMPVSRTTEQEIVVASAAEGVTNWAADESQIEVMTRQVSTSDARMWGINVGRYPTEFEAERLLLQTALAEMAVLEGALRRVNRSNAGFDALLMGLTQDEADLACRRLQARDRLCFIVSP